MMAGMGIISSRNAIGTTASRGAAAAEEEDAAGKHAEQRNAREEQLGTKDRHEAATMLASTSSQAEGLGLSDVHRSHWSAFPGEIQRDRHDKKAVRVVVVVAPVVYELRNHVTGKGSRTKPEPQQAAARNHACPRHIPIL